MLKITQSLQNTKNTRFYPIFFDISPQKSPQNPMKHLKNTSKSQKHLKKP
jgi:hypothetical protein